MLPRFAQETTWEHEYAVSLERWQGQGNARAATLSLDGAVQAATAGDSAAFSALIQHHYSAAMRTARQILLTEEAAADAVQDSLLKAHRAMPRFQDGNFRAWFLRIVTNTCYDHFRRAKRRKALSLDELMEATSGELHFQAEQLFAGELQESSADPMLLAERNESMEALLQQIDALPTWHRNAILLVDVHGYDYNAAAELLQVPLGTVKSRVSRARSALRDRLAGAGLVAPLAA